MIKYEKLGIIMKPTELQYGSTSRFNCGVILKDKIVHMLYRATSSKITDIKKYISTIGYAKLTVDGKVLHDLNKQVIFPTLPEEIMGCEDPRICMFEGEIFIFYTAFDGITARVAIAKTTDFDNYEKLGTIKHFASDKDAFIFPERINGKIAYIHRIDPDIQIDYFNSIEELLSEDSWLGYKDRYEASTIMKSEFEWENHKIGGSVPPIKTSKGWLFLYHGVNKNLEYRSGVALLDLKNPSKVIARIPYPLLEATEDYELHGDVNNVVFPEGAYVWQGELYVYYGCADKYIALAKISMDKLMNELDKYKLNK